MEQQLDRMLQLLQQQLKFYSGSMVSLLHTYGVVLN
jgi:hypothetical protein